jgi:hypothetical protein
MRWFGHVPAGSFFQSRKIAALFVLLALATFLSAEEVREQTKSKHKLEKSAALLWADPGDIKSRDLYYGIGGKKREPQAPIAFDKEDPKGTSPKFDVHDADGRKWKAKIGAEARPETAAARLLWAVGYFANENYFFLSLQVNALPAHLERGQQFVHGSAVNNVRLQRDPPHTKKAGDWSWRDKALAGSREFNGLRVMMALLSNWDLKDENNALLEDEKHLGRQILEVSDVGAAFGRAGKSYTDSITKANPDAYHRTKFIKHIHTDYVDFNFPTHPPFLYIFNPAFFFHHLRNRWIGKHVPRADAKWIGSLLAQLSPEQIRSAFRAGGYGPEEIETYTSAIEARIAELAKL